MFKTRINRGFLVIISIIAYTAATSGQTSTAGLKNKAKAEFDAGNYSGAYKLYEDLMEHYPKDGLLNYYTGICLYKTDKDITRSLELLNYASSKPQVPGDVFYHLGMVYKKNYQFGEAKAAFQKYVNIAGRSDVKKLNADLEIINAANAQELSMEYNPFEILASSLFTFSDTTYVKQVRGKGGILSQKPDELLGRNEQKGALSTFMFLPKNTQKGDILYISGYQHSRQRDADLFRLKKGGRNNLGDIEALESLNSDYDEILPYFDPVGNDLYFASRGHNSMGGFDVFKSHYDQERNTWSEPVNLGFPINSPDNEYFAMPGRDLGTILLITDRHGLDSMMTVYKLALQEPKKSLAGADSDELKKIGNLGGISAIPSITDMQEEQEDFTLKSTHMQVKGNPEKEQNAIEQNDDVNIALALDFQKKADSLSMLAKEKRIAVRSMPNPDDRWAWQTQIIEWEKKASNFSARADSSSARIARIEAQKKEAQDDIPGAIEKDKEINGITLYRYKASNENNQDQKESGDHRVSDLPLEMEDNGPKPKPQTFDTSDEPGEVVASPETNDPVETRFLIMDHSPYHVGNPFP
ncbi:MAG: tetratricopeptide repeat protein, partial [Bacteroidota bacterium]